MTLGVLSEEDWRPSRLLGAPAQVDLDLSMPSKTTRQARLVLDNTADAAAAADSDDDDDDDGEEEEEEEETGRYE